MLPRHLLLAVRNTSRWDDRMGWDYNEQTRTYTKFWELGWHTYWKDEGRDIWRPIWWRGHVEKVIHNGDMCIKESWQWQYLDRKITCQQAGQQQQLPGQQQQQQPAGEQQQHASPAPRQRCPAALGKGKGKIVKHFNNI